MSSVLVVTHYHKGTATPICCQVTSCWSNRALAGSGLGDWFMVFTGGYIYGTVAFAHEQHSFFFFFFLNCGFDLILFNGAALMMLAISS